MKNHSIIVSAPGKIHLLGEHIVVYGKPALLAAVNLRVTVTIKPCHSGERQRLQNQDSGQVCSPQSGPRMTKIIEAVVKEYLKIKAIPPYRLNISSQIPIGSGLGSSAAVSTAYITALLSFLKIKWDLNLINSLSYEAEKAFHSNPSGGDNSAVVYGGLIWFRKETPELKLIQPLSFTIPSKIAKCFVLINTGTPKESTAKMIAHVKNLSDKKPKVVQRFLENQELLVRELLTAIQGGKEKELVSIIRQGEKNLESIGVVSSCVQTIIKQIEKAGGTAKICGGGGKTKATGVLLAYHQDKNKLIQIAKSYNLPYYTVTLGVEGLKQEP